LEDWSIGVLADWLPNINPVLHCSITAVLSVFRYVADA
jgi:hypothetical protein